MAKKQPVKKKMHKSCGGNICGGSGGCVYGLGFLGALVYYIATATSFWDGFIGIFKAFLWLAFLVYELLKFLGM